MSKEHLAARGVLHHTSTTTTPFQRAYRATLTRRLFGRGLFAPMGPRALNHAIAIRLAQMQRGRR